MEIYLKAPSDSLDDDQDGGTTVSSQEYDFGDDFSLPSNMSGSELGQARKQKWKKALHTIGKLRAENAMLKEGVETARLNDVTILEDRYRGAQADLSTVRKRNNDLKDRVQKLEGDLFEALTESRKMEGRLPQPNGSSTQSSSLSSSLSSKLENYERNDTVKQMNKMRIAYETRIREYEEKIALMQGTVDHLESKNAQRKESVAMKAGRAGGVIDDELAKSLSTEMPRADRKKLESHFSLVLEEKLKTDRRTIDGLVREVDRVTELLEAREKGEDNEGGEYALGKGGDGTEPISSSIVDPKKSESTPQKPQQVRIKTREEEYNLRHIFYSVLFGALLSVAFILLKKAKEEGPNPESLSLPPFVVDLVNRAWERALYVVGGGSSSIDDSSAVAPSGSVGGGIEGTPMEMDVGAKGTIQERRV